MAGIGSYSLKWHGHAGHLNCTISALHRSDAFTDVILTTSDGQFVGAHQFVLSSCSHYFHKLFVFMNQVPKAGKTIVVLPSEVNYMTLNILLEYMYRGESIITNEQLSGVMKAARLLQVRGLYSENEVLKLRPKLQKPPGKETHGAEKMKPSQRDLIPEILYTSQKSSARGAPDSKLSSGSLTRSASSALSLSSVIKKQKTSSNESASKTKTSDSNAGEKVVIADEIIIKEEPIDWEDNKSNDSKGDSFIKQEIEELEVGENSFYVPLTCDLCHETFSTPALWVRHIEKKHPSTALAGVKKSKAEEADGGPGSYSPLTCEICQRVYMNPIEWVRHVQSHSKTEIEQAAPISTEKLNRQVNKVLHPIVEERNPDAGNFIIHRKVVLSKPLNN